MNNKKGTDGKTWEDLIYAVEDMARGILEDCGQYTPTIMPVKDGGMTIDLLLFEDKDKKRMLEAYKKRIQREKIQKYFVVSEVWQCRDKGIRPRDDPQRREALMIMEYRSDSTINTITRYFHSEGKKIVWDERVEERNVKGMHSVWDFYKPI